AGNGLRYLMQLDRNRDEYQDFLVALSTRIVQLAHGSPLLPRKEILSLEQAPNAFRVVTTVPPVLPAPPERPALPTSSPAGGAAWPARRDLPEFPARPAPPGPPTPPESTGEAAAEAATESQGGPRRVTFVLAAASAGEIAALRQQLDFYGDDFDEWTPYRPHHRDRVCVIAQMVAAQQGMTSRIKRLDGGISDLLESSTARNEIVVLLVDMWAAKLDEFRLALSAYDRRNEPTSGVLVPFNPDDAETHDNVQHLRETLAEALRKNFTRRDKLFRMDVRTREEFDRALVQIIVDSQARIFDLQRVFRPLGETRRPPRLYGP
ncbi:FxsC protein, partial [Frankia sp. EI5c]|uniref:FxsC protein n=1 Tax=Frankia sp. EI5c TaxID=683316 RepID=UPI001F5BE9C9